MDILTTILLVMLMFLCAGVLVQTSRLMRHIKILRSTDFKQMILALDRSSEQARQVISEMKESLGGCVAANNLSLETAQDLRDELSLMAQVANSAGDRILETIGKANEHPLTKIVAHLQQDLPQQHKDTV
jgi:hypothetical protein